MTKLISSDKLSMGLPKPIEQRGNKEVYNNTDIRVSTVRNRKIITTIISIISLDGKLSMVLTKMTLSEGTQDMKVKKI